MIREALIEKNEGSKEFGSMIKKETILKRGWQDLIKALMKNIFFSSIIRFGKKTWFERQKLEDGDFVFFFKILLVTRFSGPSVYLPTFRKDWIRLWHL